MRYWLGRLSLPFLVLTFALAWDAYTGLRNPARILSTPRIYAEFSLAAICFILSAVGARFRRRSD
jgi:hypothetical protein